MARVKSVEGQIRRVEGFRVCVLYEDGTDVRGDREGLPGYTFDLAGSGDMTVAHWRTMRFRKCYPGFDVSVRDARGRSVHGATRLSSVRETYL